MDSEHQAVEPGNLLRWRSSPDASDGLRSLGLGQGHPPWPPRNGRPGPGEAAAIPAPLVNKRYEEESDEPKNRWGGVEKFSGRADRVQLIRPFVPSNNVSSTPPTNIPRTRPRDSYRPAAWIKDTLSYVARIAARANHYERSQPLRLNAIKYSFGKDNLSTSGRNRDHVRRCLS
jgi:hypothetical protein